MSPKHLINRGKLAIDRQHQRGGAHKRHPEDVVSEEAGGDPPQGGGARGHDIDEGEEDGDSRAAGDGQTL